MKTDDSYEPSPVAGLRGRNLLGVREGWAGLGAVR